MSSVDPEAFNPQRHTLMKSRSELPSEYVPLLRIAD